jgi:acetyl esterase/lipase
MSRVHLSLLVAGRLPAPAAVGQCIPFPRTLRRKELRLHLSSSRLRREISSVENLTRRELMKNGGIAALAALILPEGVVLCAQAAATGDISFVNPELREAARQLLSSNAMPELSASTLQATREGMKSFSWPPLSAPAFAKRSIKGPPGAADVDIYVVNAKPGTSRPAILHMHGGGYVAGEAVGGIAGLQETAAALDCVIVTVDYRLAPETTFKGSIEDNYTALRWLHANGPEVGADPKRIAVMGESAGGGHAALLALTARDRGEVPVVLQLLIYPMLDDRTGVTLHPPAPIGTLLWTAAKNRFGWHSFLGQAPGTRGVPEQAVPARYRSLAGLPPTFIGVGSIDLFVDEDLAYARRLIDAGVSTELVVVPGAFHAFDAIARETSLAKNFTAAKQDALRRAFAPPA